MFAGSILAVATGAQDPSNRRPDRDRSHLPTSQEDFRRHRQTVYARAFVDDYRRRVGDAVRSESIEALDLLGRRLADSGIQDTDQRRRISLRVDAALRAGETDLALRFAAIYLTLYEPAFRAAPRSVVRAMADEARDLLAQADELGELVAPMLKVYLVWAVIDGFGRVGEKQLADALRPRLRTELVAMAFGPSFAGVDQPYYLEFRQSMEGDLSEDSGDFIEALRTASSEPNYSTLLLEASYHRELAWEARGTGPASGVGRARFQAFQKELDRAIELATEAWELQPELPNAPATIVGFLGPIGTSFPERKQWFDRATETFVDFEKAYEDLMWFEVPRWGGSPQNLLRLCAEWSESPAGTEVHDHVGAALRHLDDDIDPVRMWSSNDVREIVDRAYEAQMLRPQTHGAQLWDRSMYAVMLAYGKRIEEAQRVFDELDGDFANGVLKSIDMDPKWWAETVVAPERRKRAPRVIGSDNVAGWQSTIDPARPLPSAADLPTAASFIEGSHDWLAAYLVAEFDRCGATPEESIAKVREFIRLYPVVGRRKATITQLQPLLDAVDEVAAVDTEDALVLYTTSRVLEQAGRRNEAEDRLMAAAREVVSSGYGPLVRFLILRTHARMLGSRVSDSDPASRTAWQAAATAMREQLLPLAEAEEFRGDRARQLFSLVVPINEVGTFVSAYAARDVEALLASETADPWYQHVIAGMSALSEALVGPLVLYPEDVRLLHAERCERAAMHLGKAFELRPDWPEVPTAMIQLSTVWPTEGSARDWLERGMRAEFDYDQLYRSYLVSRSPRNGGSVAAMFGFAVELLRTQRFDTSVPAMFPEVMWNIGRELDYTRWTYASPDAREAFDAYCAGLLAAEDSDQRRQDVDKARVAVHWSNGDYDRAIAAWERLGREVDRSWAVLVHASASQIARELALAADQDS